jgi:aldose sugar dehydrogenase
VKPTGRLVFAMSILATMLATGPPVQARTAVTFKARTVLTGLSFPTAFAIDGDGRFFFGEKNTGMIKVYDPAAKTTTKFFTVSSLSSQNEQGLLGLALDPKYPTKPFVYAYATRTDGSGILRDEILKIKDDIGTGKLSAIIFTSDTVAGQYHDGGHIAFGPDGMLYAVVGEAHDSSNAQDLSNNAGKVLRMNRKGQAPSNNPYPGKLIWSYGLRNSFGFAFDPQTGNLWETENGPECNDEVNRILKGRNYGWGRSETCSTPPNPPVNTNQDGPNPVLPLRFFTPTIAPTGAAFCSGCGLTGSEGDLFFGDFKSGSIRRVVLTANRTGIASMSIKFTNSSGILSIERGPDMAIYFSDPGGIFELVNG